MELLISGSYSRVQKASDIKNFIKNEVFIDQRNNMPMEMDAWGLWHALEYHQKIEESDISEEISTLINVLNIKLDSLNFQHNHWGNQETHYRFVTYFIALIIKLKNEGFIIKNDKLEELLSQSLTWSEKISIGLWFLHDSQELKNKKKYHDYHFQSKIYGENFNNMLILNTHLNFIYTYLFYLNSKPNKNTSDVISENIDQAIDAYKHFLEIKENIFFKYLDKPIRNYWFKYYKSNNRFINKFLNLYFYRIRLKQKYKYPILFFDDGYTERQIKLAGTSAQYHLINLNDIAKLVVQLSIYDENKYDSVIQKSKIIVNKGLLFCVTNKNYHKLLTTNLESYAIEYCEALALSFQWDNINQHEVELYCQIRNYLPPTPLLKGYDDIAFPPHLCHNYQKLKKRNQIKSIDIFPIDILKNKFIYIDTKNVTYSLKYYDK